MLAIGWLELNPAWRRNNRDGTARNGALPALTAATPAAATKRVLVAEFDLYHAAVEVAMKCGGDACDLGCCAAQACDSGFGIDLIGDVCLTQGAEAARKINPLRERPRV